MSIYISLHTADACTQPVSQPGNMARRSHKLSEEKNGILFKMNLMGIGLDGSAPVWCTSSDYVVLSIESNLFKYIIIIRGTNRLSTGTYVYILISDDLCSNFMCALLTRQSTKLVWRFLIVHTDSLTHGLSTFWNRSDAEPELTEHSMHHANTDAYPRTFKLNLLNKSQQVRNSYTEDCRTTHTIRLIFVWFFVFVLFVCCRRGDLAARLQFCELYFYCAHCHCHRLGAHAHCHNGVIYLMSN